MAPNHRPVWPFLTSGLRRPGLRGGWRQDAPHNLPVEPVIATAPDRTASPARPARWWARPITVSVVVHGLALGLWIALAAPAVTTAHEATPTVSFSLPLSHVEPMPDPLIEELAAIDVVDHADAIETPEELVPEDLLPEPSELDPLVARPDRTIRITPSMFRRRAPEPAQLPAPEVAPTPAPTAASPKTPTPERAAQPALRTVSVPPVLRYYPESLRRRGVEGKVVVRVTVGARGFVVDAQVASSSGHSALDRAALRIVRDTRFAAPGMTRVGRLPIRFRLQ